MECDGGNQGHTRPNKTLNQNTNLILFVAYDFDDQPVRVANSNTHNVPSNDKHNVAINTMNNEERKLQFNPYTFFSIKVKRKLRYREYFIQ